MEHLTPEGGKVCRTWTGLKPPQLAVTRSVYIESTEAHLAAVGERACFVATLMRQKPCDSEK